MKLVSVVVPVYNVEKYLEKCLDSLVRQDYENVEIILVDDGSIDSSGRICDKYSQQYLNVTVIHQNNMGLSGARNTGTSYATGYYLAFVDSDDWVSTDYLSYQVKLAELYDADIVAVSQQFVWDDCEPKTIDYDSEKIIKYKKLDAMEELLYGRNLKVSACKLYKTEIVKTIPFKVGVLYEDLGIMYKIFDLADTVVSSNLPMYFYRKRVGSITNTRFDKRHLMIIEHSNQQYDFIIYKYPSLACAAGYRCAYSVTELAPMVLAGHDKESFKFLQAELKKHYSELANNSKVRFIFKVRAFSIKHGYYLASLSFKCEKILKKLLGKTLYNE